MHRRSVLFAALPLGAVPGCIPTSSVVLSLGTERTADDLERVEAVLERNGFARLWAGGPNEIRRPRIEDSLSITAHFESAEPGFTAAVRLQKSGGALTMTFREWNTRLSESGKDKLAQVHAKLVEAFGEAVRIQRSSE